jgi:hypothetical protein
MHNLLWTLDQLIDGFGVKDLDVEYFNENIEHFYKEKIPCLIEGLCRLSDIKGLGDINIYTFKEKIQDNLSKIFWTKITSNIYEKDKGLNNYYSKIPYMPYLIRSILMELKSNFSKYWNSWKFDIVFDWDNQRVEFFWLNDIKELTDEERERIFSTKTWLQVMADQIKIIWWKMDDFWPKEIDWEKKYIIKFHIPYCQEIEQL